MTIIVSEGIYRIVYSVLRLVYSLTPSFLYPPYHTNGRLNAFITSTLSSALPIAMPVFYSFSIHHDPNEWSKEHGNPSYIFDLLLSVINLAVQTVDIVESLPKLKL